MTVTQLSAGDIIEAKCTKCRDTLNHRIVAMVGNKVVRVECNTCNGVHNYYPPPAAKAAKPSRASSAAPRTPGVPRAVKKDPLETEREEWATLQPTFNTDRARPYDMNSSYQNKNLIMHPVFGLGVVKAVITPNKMQVLFRDGIKLLRCL